MSDIADKIYAATGLTLGAEAAAAIEKMIQAENEKLRAALRLAIDAVEHWASYASPYFQEKHDLAGDLQELRAALGEKE
jgi:hypothetical protein